MGLSRFIRATGFLVLGLAAAQGQIDPFKRELIQLGYNQNLQGHGPLSAYAFYYLNVPDFIRTNLTMRLAVAPVYLDSEVGLRKLIGENTDLAFGLAGGGFADSYLEVRRGKFESKESFTGHGGGASASLYHLFNPGKQIPLNGVLRLESYYSLYERDEKTARNFSLPDDRNNVYLRTGLRWGGTEPLMMPTVAMEISGWYQAQIRTTSGNYGFDGDRAVEPVSHLFWGRALLAYTLPKRHHHFNVSLTLGSSIDVDRFSAYRLGGVLPLAAEFPLTLPGYYYQEISAQHFALLGGNYAIPLDRADRWAINLLATTAYVDYAPDLEQPGRWHSGVGAGIRYRSPKEAWQIVLAYAYGIDAIRSRGRGAHSIGFLLQFDLERARVPLFEPGEFPIRSRGLQRIFGRFLE